METLKKRVSASELSEEFGGDRAVIGPKWVEFRKVTYKLTFCKNDLDKQP